MGTSRFLQRSTDPLRCPRGRDSEKSIFGRGFLKHKRASVRLRSMQLRTPGQDNPNAIGHPLMICIAREICHMEVNLKSEELLFATGSDSIILFLTILSRTIIPPGYQDFGKSFGPHLVRLLSMQL
ncbi:hypothetical protein A0H81_05054 [Grifola frondosa]|uniref:Uncharacterized protein n=1 Tax=Grifola frondosa TaxID=5627 RepID=A0A1C7MCQ9_GRIFR|nr:hypothetical protein A0H81_05054 [Grifola frondosa]